MKDATFTHQDAGESYGWWHKGLRIIPSLHTCKARDDSKTSYFQTQKPVNRAKTVIQVGRKCPI